MKRRQMLQWLAGAGAIPLLGCGSRSSPTADDLATSCAELPEETQGPYPGDGSNGPDVLAKSGIVRSDIRASFGTLSGTAAGVPLTLQLTLVDPNSRCAPLAGYAAYVWHCDRNGYYSLYTVPNQNYLRGVQAADANGVVRFTSIFPACYSGRWPHIHVEIYRSLAAATSVGNKLATSQIALPADACNQVFKTPGYEQSIGNFASTSLATDNVFSDGATLELAHLTGSVSAGYLATLDLGV